MITLVYFKKQLELRRISNLHKKTIGSMIKHQRTKMRMTLEEGSEGICSVSYLSKVENNMIVPSDKFLEDLVKRFELKVISTQNEKKIEDFFNQIITSLFENKPLTYEHIDIDQLSYQGKILSLIYKIDRLEFEKIKNDHDELLGYIKNFNDQEVLLYVLFTSIQYDHMNLHKEAFLLLEEVENIRYKNIYLHYLLLYYKLKHAFKLNHHATILKEYQTLLSELIEYGHFQFAQNLKVDYLDYLAQFEKTHIYKAEVEKLLGVDEKQKQYLLAKNLYYRKNYQQSLSYIQEINTEEALILKLKNYDVLGEIHLIHQILSKKIVFQKASHAIIFEFFQIKYEHVKKPILAYLKQTFILNQYVIDDVETNLFFIEQGTSQYKEQSFYKDGTHFLQTLTRKIKTNSKI